MNFLRVEPSAIPALAIARRRRWRWALAILLGLILAVAASRPLYRGGKAWRARGLAAEAEKLIASRQWPAAASKAHAAYQLSPTEPDALRAVARLYSRAGLPTALSYWKALLALPEASLADRREAAATSLQSQQLDFTGEQIATLLEREPSSLESLELAAQWAVMRNDRPAALDFTGRLLALKSDHPGARLLRAQLLFHSPETKARAEGQRLLRQMAATPGTPALAAQLQLASDVRLGPEEASTIATGLENHPQSTPEHQLAAVSLRLRFAPDQRLPLIEQAVQKLRSRGPEGVVALGRWLGPRGETARILDLISLEESLTRQDLFLVRIDALAALQRWSEIQTILEKEKVPIEPFHREIFLARAATELRETHRAEVHWARAFQAASKSASLHYLAQYTSRTGQTVIAEKAWRQLARQPAFAMQAHLALVPILESQGNTRALRDVVRQITRLAPADPAPRNDAAYLDLLLGENIEPARKIAEQLVQSHPTQLAHRTTLALAHLRTQDPVAALGVYQGLEIDWPHSLPSAQVIYLAALRANGRTSDSWASTIPLPQLKPEERVLLAGPANGSPPAAPRPE